MATKLGPITSSSVPVSKRPSLLSPFPVAFGPRNVSFSSTSSSSSSKSIKPSSRRTPSVAVRAHLHEDSGVLIHGPVTVTDTGVVHSPWTITEDENEIKMQLEMPGVASEDVSVKVEGDVVVIKDLGRHLYSPYDTALQLPTYCDKHDTRATLVNGVLHITVPKKPIRVPVKPSSIVEDQAGVRVGSFGDVHVPFPIEPEDWHNRIALLDSPNYVRIPWGHTEDDKEVKVSYDVPGLSVNDIAVNIMGDLLVIHGVKDKVDSLGRKILGCHAKLQLPKGCVRDKAYALLKTGILYITVPKIPFDSNILHPTDVPVMSG